MILHPTIVLGVGSTGKYVVANVQKYLYEVLNGEALDLFKCIVLETALDEQEHILLPANARSKPVSIKVDNIGAALFGMKRVLGNEFDWCPDDLHIDGPGAGNKRAGGRLMLLHHMSMVTGILTSAMQEIKTAAGAPQTTSRINELLSQRGADAAPQAMSRNAVPIVMVVGTLAGGTCSGACIDLGYLIRHIEPGARREAIFIVPDNANIPTFLANSWAALSDLIYFTENPKDYKVAWVSQAQARDGHDEGAKTAPKPPFERIYLISQRDMEGNSHLSYNASPNSPLCMMVGLSIAANLLGLYELRQQRLVDLNTRVGSNPIHNVFLTYGLRGISYPKYEISEAAACKIIERICQNWLSKEQCYVQGRREDLQEDEVKKEGQKIWNLKCPTIWDGLRGALRLGEYAHRIKTTKIEDVGEYLFKELTENRDGTIFRAIDQNVENRRRELQNMIRAAVVEVLQQKQNLMYGEWFLSGIQSEISRMLKYWQGLQVPSSENDMPSWQKRVRELVVRMEDRYKSVAANALGERLEVIEDELEQLITRLEMFLMCGTLSRISRWADEELKAKLKTAGDVLMALQAFSNQRTQNISAGLADRTGPLLKISRSRDRQFDDEITTLARFEPNIPGRDFVDYVGDKFKGLLPLETQDRNAAKENLFNDLLDLIQPILIQQLQAGTIDIANEVERQGVGPQAVQRAHSAQRLSLAVTHPFMTGQDNIPSLLLTKREEVSTRLTRFLQNMDRTFPAAKCDELPLFDHMALFYQEGGKFELESLAHADDYKRAYAAEKRNGEANLEPLRKLRRNENTQAATVASPSVRSE